MLVGASGKEDIIRLEIRKHIQSFWPNSAIFEEHWAKGPIEENLPGFRVLRLDSRTPNRPHVYVTSGCFAAEPTDHVRHEFFLLSPTRDDRHIETLTMLANFHADERYRLDVGKTVAIGDPWMDESTSDHLLVSVPYPYGPQLRFLWLMPITPREAGYAELNGAEALEQKFDHAKPDYLDPRRKSVV